MDLGLFCADVGCFCGNIGLFCGDIKAVSWRYWALLRINWFFVWRYRAVLLRCRVLFVRVPLYVYTYICICIYIYIYMYIYIYIDA